MFSIIYKNLQFEGWLVISKSFFLRENIYLVGLYNSIRKILITVSNFLCQVRFKNQTNVKISICVSTKYSEIIDENLKIARHQIEKLKLKSLKAKKVYNISQIEVFFVEGAKT